MRWARDSCPCHSKTVFAVTNWRRADSRSQHGDDALTLIKQLVNRMNQSGLINGGKRTQDQSLKVLTSIGLTHEDARQFLKRLPQLQRRRGGTIISNPRDFSKFQRLTIVLCAWSLSVWLYVIAMQLQYPEAVYWPLAVWVPIRLDYLGEAAFVLSFVFAVITALIQINRNITHERLELRLNELGEESS